MRNGRGNSSENDKGYVLVTGASSGIGAESVEVLLSAGYKVFAGVRRDDDYNRLSSVPGVHPLVIDLMKPQTIEAAVVTIERHTISAPLRGIVNNAGMGVSGPIELMTTKLIAELVTTNVIGPMLLIKALLPLLRRSRGRIVNVGSAGGRIAVPFTSCYSATKHALNGLTDSLRMELKPWGVFVSMIEPGAVQTRMLRQGKKNLKALFYEGNTAVQDAYAPATGIFAQRMEEQLKHASSPLTVARTILHAIDSKRPRARYVIGLQTRILTALCSVLPRRWQDWLITRLLLRLPSSSLSTTAPKFVGA